MITLRSAVEGMGSVEQMEYAATGSGGWLSGRRLRMLLCCAGAPFLIMLDTNIVAVSLPAIARDLQGEFTAVEWVVSAYILPFAALLIPAGSLADRYGRKRMLLAGLSIFAVASLLCGLAPNLTVLNWARALQAVGAALQLSASLAVIARGFEPHERTRVYAIWATVMGMAPALGPLVGGVLTSYFGWRWAFYINLPLGFGLLWLAISSVDESRDPNARRLDMPGILLFGSGLFSVVWALIEANNVGWESAETLSKLAFGALLLLGFVIAERLHPRPMIDLKLFRNPAVVGAAIAMLGYAAAAQVMMTILPLYLQDAFNFSPARAGAAMIPFALPMLIGPSIGGKLATVFSSRGMLALGLGLVAVGDAIIAVAILGDLGYWPTACGMLITGTAAGLLNSETTKAQIAAVPAERAGMASGIAGATRFIGIIGGVAGLGAVLAATSEAALKSAGSLTGQAIDWHALNLRIIGGDAAGALASLPDHVRSALVSAIHDSVQSGFGMAIVVASIMALASSAASWVLMRGAAPVATTEHRAAN